MDRTAGLATEGPGHIDRRDLLLALLIVVATFGTRMYRIDTPRTMVFDELYYPSTGAEFLRDWRYGITANVFEWTHPHVSKYVMGASLALFGNDRVTGSVAVGASVLDVAFEPAYPSSLAPGGFGGDQIAMATGNDVRIAIHGVFPPEFVIPLPGATRVAFDRQADRLYVATVDGTIWAIDCSLIDGLVGQGTGARAPTAVRLGSVGAPATGLWVPVHGRVIVGTGGDQLTVLDGKSGATLATRSIPGFAGLASVNVAGKSLMAVADAAGVETLDAATLKTASQSGLPAPPTGIDFVDGSAFGWANQNTLPIPTLYVALDGARMAAVQVAPDGGLKTWDVFPMPGPVTAVHWDRPSNMVHVQGHTPDGRPTIYVVEPHTDSVFADAVLPFEPVTWTLDVQPDTPSLDRQRAIVFPANGDAAVVDTGSHAFAWRLPGVLAGALTAGLMFLLARMLFRRKSVAYLLAIVMALDGFLFSQGRIAMNDALLGFFIVAAITLLAALFHHGGRGRWGWLVPAVGLPVVGVLLGLAFATKWIGAYAMGAAVLLVLAQSPIGRRLVLVGLIGLTGVLGWQAVAGDPPNVTFLLIMLGLTSVAAVLVARDRTAARDRTPAAPDPSDPGARDKPGWLDPRRRFGLPFVYAIVCLTLVPAVVYVASYVPWALAASGGPQLFAGWPPGHTGQTFLDLQAKMYAYHNDLRTPHGESSPWWAWPFGLRPIWGYYNTFSDGSQSLVLLVGNPVLQWLSVPAIAFGAWQAWRRRSFGLAFVLIVFLSLWLAWARIDRASFNYHYYTTLMFGYVLLAYFLAELWDGPSRRTWNLARVAFALVLVAPALMWIFRGPLCAIANVGARNPAAFACTRPLADLAVPLALWLVGAAILGWRVLGSTRPTRLVVGILVAAGVAFAVLFPAVSAWQIPNGWPLIYQGLLPTWDISFAFASNTRPSTVTPLLGIGAVVTLIVAAAVAWLVMRTTGGSDGPGGSGSMRPRLARLLSRRRPSAGAGPSGTVQARLQSLAGPGPVVASAAEGVPVGAAGPGGGAVTAARVAAPRIGVPARSAARIAVAGPMAVPARPVPGRVVRGQLVGVWGRLTGNGAPDKYRIPLGLFLLAAFVYAFINHGRPARLDYFVPLANAFLHGQIGISSAYSWLDEVLPGGHGLYYVLYPPGPAVLLLPFVWLFGPGLEQAWASILLGAANVALLSIIIDRMGMSRQIRLVVPLVFAFGTIVWFSAQLGTSWHLAHVTAMFFTFLAILACQRGAPTLIIGLLFGAAVITRLPVGLGIAFFLAYVADQVLRGRNGAEVPFGHIGSQSGSVWPIRLSLRRFLVNAFPLGVGLAIPVAFYLAYNYLRFSSIFQTGYSLFPGIQHNPAYPYGLFSIGYLSNDFSRLFLSGAAPIKDFPWLAPRIDGGPSLLLISPIFLWALRSRRLDWFNLGAWLSIGLTLIPILTYLDAGNLQFGFRYGQDVYPFVLLLVARGLGARIGRWAWVAIGVGGAVNLWGMAFAYGGWWTGSSAVSALGFVPQVMVVAAVGAGVLVILLAGMRWIRRRPFVQRQMGSQ